jgi:hypothetical protein
MEKSRLISILRSFSKKEVREFKKWVHSPAHNQREDVAALMEYLFAKDHLFKDKYLSKERAFSTIYDEETYDDDKMRQVMHFLLKCTEEFLMYQGQLNDEVHGKTVLAHEYRRRQLDKSFQRTLQQARQLQEKHPFRDRHYWRHQYAMNYEEYSYLSGLRRSVPLNLQEVSNSLDTAFLADKMRLACLMQAHQTVYQTDYELNLLEKLMEYVENGPMLEVPAIAIYYYNYKAIDDKEDESHFQNLKQQLFEHGDLFPQSESRDLYLLAMNYCIRRSNAGVEKYQRELFELFRSGLEKKILLQNGVLSRWTFKNAVTTGTLQKEFEWTERFIHNFKVYLEPKYRDNFVHFCLAKLYYEKEEFQEAMGLFSKVDLDDMFLYLDAKTMQLKIYYELDEFNLLDSLLESMGTYVRRKDVIGYHKANYKNIIKFTKKLVHLNPYEQQQRKKLEKEIQEANPLTERKWLLGQISRMAG